MSSTQITVADLIEQLRNFPPDMLVATPQNINFNELYEGILDGPCFPLQKVRCCDVRSGFNPIEMGDMGDSFEVVILQ